MMLFTVTNSCHGEKDQSKHHEDKRLHDTNQNLQQEEGKGDEECHKKSHCRQYDLAGKDIAEKTKGKRNDTGKFANNLQNTNENVDPFHETMTAGIPKLVEVPTPQRADSMDLYHDHRS